MVTDIDPDTDEDLDLVATVDAWDEREHETRREAERLRHARRTRWFRVAVSLLVFGSLGGAAYLVIPMWQEHKAAQAKAAADKHEAQEQAWQACVNAIGIERCDLIEERLAERCLDSGETRSCLKHELEP